MTASIRRIPGPPTRFGIFEVRGSLRDAKHPKEPVRELRVTGAAETLEPLAALEELATLELEETSGVDLGSIGQLSSLVDLALVDIRNSILPRSLTLPAALRRLMVFTEYENAPEATRLIAAIDWSSATGLEDMALNAQSGAPATGDLSLLEGLRNLTSLRIFDVVHRGPGPSPVDPPFDGLPPHLRRIEIDAWDPEPARRALAARCPEATIVVEQRLPPDEAQATSWDIDHLGDEGTWSAYGSLADLPQFRDCELEYDAMNAAQAMIGRVDAALGARLDWDHESDGTSVTASSRADVETALRIIGATADRS